jgi:anti-anti-sigma regulatory factor
MNVEKKAKTALLTIGCDLNNSVSREFVETVKSLIAEGMKRIEIDFTSVSFVDSFAISNMIIFFNEPELEFTFKNAGKPVKKIFDIMSFEKKVLFE